MKHSAFFRRLLAGAATLAFAAAAALPVMATTYPGNISAPDKITTTGSITVNLPNGAQKTDGLTVTAYKVLDKVTSDDLAEETENGTNDSNSLYMVADGFDTFFSDAKAAYLTETSAAALQQANKLRLTYNGQTGKLQLEAAGADETSVSGSRIILENGPGNKLDTKPEFFAASLVSKVAGDAADTNDQTTPFVNASQQETFADWVSRYILSQSPTPNWTTKSAAFGATDATVTLDDLTLGYYALLITEPSAPANPGTTGEDVIHHSILNLPGNNVKVTAKITPISLEKTVANKTVADINDQDIRKATSDANTTAGTLAHNTTAQIGDTLTYTAQTNVPYLTSYDLSDYTNLVQNGQYKEPAAGTDFLFKFGDTMTNQQLVPLSVKVKFNNTTEYTVDENSKTTTDGKDYYQIKNGTTVIGFLKDEGYDLTTKQNSFTVYLDLAVMKQAQHDGGTVSFTYNAVLKGEATSTGNTNEATVTVSNDPYSKSTYDVLKDQTDVDTYDVEIQKIFSDESKIYDNVKFTLYYAGDNGILPNTNSRVPVKFLAQTPSGYYIKAEDTATGYVTELALNSDTTSGEETGGRLQLHGLGEGTYYLVETATATNYIKADAIKIVITANDEKDFKLVDTTPTTNKSTVTIGNMSVEYSQLDKQLVTPGNTADHGIYFDVLNQKGFTLPVTGSEGTWLLTIGGILLFAAAAAVLYLARKKKD